jgi:hypothetical protein
VTWASTFSGAPPGRHLWSFFLKAVLGDDPFDAPRADHPAGLPKLLGDHLRRGVAVEEAVADDLADDFGCSPIVCLWAAFLAPQSEGASSLKGGAELKVTLLAVAELLGGLERPRVLTLPFDEHPQLVGDLVVLAHIQRTTRPDQRMAREIESRHPGFLRESRPLLGLHGTNALKPG